MGYSADVFMFLIAVLFVDFADQKQWLEEGLVSHLHLENRL